MGQKTMGQTAPAGHDRAPDVTDAPTPVTIFDTTLRDGEQAPGISLDTKEKLEIAEQLARLHVDVIEAGFPIASQGDFEAVKAIAEDVGTRPGAPAIAALARCTPGDVDRAAEAIAAASRNRLHVFLSTSEIHRRAMLRASEDDIVEQTIRAVKQAREYTDDVEFSPQDATRTEVDFLYRVIDEAVAAGATTVNIPDTVGYALPHDFGQMIAEVVRRVGHDIIVSVHCHNDLGLAVANSVEAVRNGARQVEVAVNGIGERAGNCSMEEIVMALVTRADLLRRTTGVTTSEIARTSRLVSTLTGYPVQYNKAVVGKNAFAHESGIHQHGVLQDRLTYEIMRAEDIGLVGSQIVLGKHSGRHAFSKQLADMGYHLTPEEMARAFERFKELADRKVELSDKDLEAIVTDYVYTKDDDAFELISLQVSGGTGAASAEGEPAFTPTATVRVRRVADDIVLDESSTGDGMIDAVCGAIRRALGIGATLVNFNVASVTGGIDALGDVTVQVEVDGRRFTGRGVSTDVVEASARAYLHALNKSVRLRDRAPAPEQVP